MYLYPIVHEYREGKIEKEPAKEFEIKSMKYEDKNNQLCCYAQCTFCIMGQQLNFYGKFNFFIKSRLSENKLIVQLFS